MQFELLSVFFQATFENNIPGFRWKFPPAIRSVGYEERMIVFLIVR
jgi:hypothetical protein